MKLAGGAVYFIFYINDNFLDIKYYAKTPTSLITLTTKLTVYLPKRPTNYRTEIIYLSISKNKYIRFIRTSLLEGKIIIKNVIKVIIIIYQIYKQLNISDNTISRYQNNRIS